MENASKALIIAGAILLSILIIGFGMAIYNNSSATKGVADLSGEQIAAHNQSFRAYQGKINGTQVKALLNKIRNNNIEHKDRIINISYSETGKKWTSNVSGFEIGDGNTGKYYHSFACDDTKPVIPEMIDKTNDNTTYKVEFDESSSTGCINLCYIYLATN